MRHALGLACLLSLTACAGCDQLGGGAAENSTAAPATAAGGVAIVDLDEVARRLGRDVLMMQSIQEKQAEVNAEVIAFQHRLREQYETRQQELAAQPARSLEEEQAWQQELDGLQQELSQQLAEMQQAARNEVALFRQRLVGIYREEARPICRDIAAARGLSIVMTKDESHMLVYNDAVDITDDVTQRLASTTRPGSGAPSTGSTAPIAPPITAGQPPASEVR